MLIVFCSESRADVAEQAIRAQAGGGLEARVPALVVSLTKLRGDAGLAVSVERWMEIGRAHV